MSIVQQRVVVEAPRARVWEALADVGYVHNWHPKVKASPVLSPRPTGVGATRRCHFYDGTSVVEEVVGVREQERLDIRLSDFSMPLKEARAYVELQSLDEGRTEVSFTMEYEPKYGPLGWLMDATMMRPMMNAMFEQVLGGLRHHVTTGEYVGENGAVGEAA